MDLCPLHEPAVFEMFKERGYGIAELNNVLYRRLDPTEEFPPAPARLRDSPRTVRRKRQISGAIVEQAFFPDGAPEPFRGLIAPLYQMEGGHHLRRQHRGQDGGVRRRAGDPGAPGLRAVRSRNAAPNFAGAGCRLRLLRVRMAAAAEAGCEYAVVVTQGGSTSQRNCERLGFRVAYSKVTVIKQLGKK